MGPSTTTFGVYVLAWTAGWSLLAGGLMVWDKRQARRARRRIRERTLLGLSFLGGAPGSWLAMLGVRHKTRHWRFRVFVPAAAVLWLALVVWYW